jgi:hypothetical protein
MLDRKFTRTGEGGVIIEQFMQDVSWEEVRAHRDAALVSSDWRALKDVTLPNAWKEYRQALRELPQQHDEANDAADAFPEAPE